MKKMGIGLVAVLVVLGAVSIITPKVIAPIYQANLNNLVEKINDSLGYNAKVESMTSSWFGSEAVVSIHISINEFSTQKNFTYPDLKAELLISSSYGPLLFSNNAWLGLYETNVVYQGDQLRESYQWDQSLPFLRVSLVENLLGNMKINAGIPSLYNEELLMLIDGYTAKGSKVGNLLVINGVTPIISVSNVITNDVTMEAKNITTLVMMDADLNTMFDDFYNSKFSLTIESITSDLLNIDQAKVAFITSVEQDTQIEGLDKDIKIGKFEFNASAGNLDTGDFNIENLIFASELSGLNSKAFVKYDNYLKERVNENATTILTAEDYLAFFRENLSDFLITKPEFNIINFSGEFPEGRFYANFHSQLVDIKGTVSLEEMDSPLFWQSHSLVTSHMEADIDLIKMIAARFIALQMQTSADELIVQQQVDGLLNQLEVQGTIIKKDDKFISDFNMQQGETRINDKTVAF